MNRENSEKFQMLTRVVDFLASYVSLFSKNSAAAEILDALESGIRKLSEAASAQISAETAMRIGRSAKAASKEGLKTLLGRASKIAIALDNDKVQLPRKPTEQALIDCGHAFAVDAESMKKDFARHGLPLEDVAAAVEDLERTILEYAVAKAKRLTAKQEWATGMDEALGTLRRFDALVANALADNPGALTSYAAARFIEAKRGRKVTKKAKAAAPEVVAPPVAPESPPAPVAASRAVA